MKRITLISDTHNKHNQLMKDLPGGDIIICGGDISSRGYVHEVENFCKWFNKLNNYTHKIFIAGNHDFLFENDPEEAYFIYNNYKNIKYLQDNLHIVDDIKIWGAPWQPEFCNWAFNLPRQGLKLAEKWNNIPDDIDIIITHGPAFGHLDIVDGRTDNLGCELLASRIEKIKPKIHMGGHIHSGYGYKFHDNTHFFNASVLDESYVYTQRPFTFDWDKETNEITFYESI